MTGHMHPFLEREVPNPEGITSLNDTDAKAMNNSHIPMFIFGPDGQSEIYSPWKQ